MNNKLFLAFIFLSAVKLTIGCECFYTPPLETIKQFRHIFVANVDSTGKATVIKSWKGSYAPDSIFLYDFEYSCGIYKSAWSGGIYVFLVSSIDSTICNHTEGYYFFEHVEQLDEEFRSSICVSKSHAERLKTLDYERSNIVYANNAKPIDINGKNVIFIQELRATFPRSLVQSNKLEIVEFHNLNRQSGFHNTNFNLIEQDVSIDSVEYDYIFKVEISHQFKQVSVKEKSRLIRFLKKELRRLKR